MKIAERKTGSLLEKTLWNLQTNYLMVQILNCTGHGWIDNITIKCKKCSSVNTKREEYVLDTWHNSGSAPYSSLTDEEYQNEIPVPFLTEGIDQTRGWAYTLLIENVILNNTATPPYKSFLFQGHVLDEKGGKMS